MQPEEPKQTIYNSLYRHGVDEKRRVQVPAKWRPEEPGMEFTILLWKKQAEGACLRVLPPRRVEAILKRINELPDTDPHKLVLRRDFGSNSEQVTLDKGGRICLPEDKSKAAGIGKEAVLIGLMDWFEIWNPERYELVTASDGLRASEALRLME